MARLNPSQFQGHRSLVAYVNSQRVYCSSSHVYWGISLEGLFLTHLRTHGLTLLFMIKYTHYLLPAATFAIQTVTVVHSSYTQLVNSQQFLSRTQAFDTVIA